MAWSDAARAAAAEARRQHMTAKQRTQSMSTDYARVHGGRLQSMVYRRGIATALKAVRSGEYPGAFSAAAQKQLFRDATTSTAYRNTRRARGEGWGEARYGQYAKERRK